MLKKFFWIKLHYKFEWNFNNHFYHVKILIIQKTPLHIAVEKENERIIKLLLLHKKIDVNLFGLLKNENISKKNALIIAIENESIEIIKLLLSYPGIDTNSINIIILFYAN